MIIGYILALETVYQQISGCEKEEEIAEFVQKGQFVMVV
jgi:hypothetical protein